MELYHGTGGPQWNRSAGWLKVRKKLPCRPRSWANVSLLQVYSHRTARVNSHLLRQRLTLFSRKGSYCGWEGVTCAAGGGGHDVAALNLTKNALRGTMRLALSG